MSRTPYNFQEIYISNSTIHYNMRGFITNLIIFSCNLTYIISLISLFGMCQRPFEAPQNQLEVKEFQKNSIQEVLSKKSQLKGFRTFGQIQFDPMGVSSSLLICHNGHTYQGLLLLLLSHFSRVRLCVTPQMAAHQALCPWDSRGKNTGVGSHFHLQCMKVKSESEVAQS